MQHLVFFMLCLMTVTYSGGVVLGVGPLMTAMANGGYFKASCGGRAVPCSEQYNHLASMFNGGFQVMTWGSVAVTLTLNRCGPRMVALAGCFITGCAALGFWYAHVDADVHIFMICYGFFGLGMNSVYIATMNGLIGVFTQNTEIYVTVIAGLFNASGATLMIATKVLSVKVQGFFFFYACYSIVVFVFVLAVFPPKPYTASQRFSFFRPCCGFGCGDEPELEGFEALEANAASPCSPHSPLSPARVKGEINPNFYELTFGLALRKPRFWGFVLSFSWCALINVVVGGQFALIAHKKDPAQASFVTSYMYPLIGCVGVIIWSPFVGIAAGKVGLWFVALIMIISAQMLCVATLFLEGATSLYIMLVCYSLVGSFAYSLQFAYITVAFPTALYGPLLALTIAVQGTVGFVAWPGLSPDPWGEEAYKKCMLVVFVPSFLCYVFPLMQYRNDLYRMNFLNNALARRHDTAAVMQGFLKYDVNGTGQLTRENCVPLVKDMFLSLSNGEPHTEDVYSVIEVLHSALDQDNDGLLTMEDFQLLGTPTFGPLCDEIMAMVRLKSPLKSSNYSTHDEQ